MLCAKVARCPLKSAREKRAGSLVPVVRYSVGGGVEVLGRQGQMWPILINLCSMQPGRILPNLGGAGEGEH